MLKSLAVKQMKSGGKLSRVGAAVATGDEERRAEEHQAGFPMKIKNISRMYFRGVIYQLVLQI